VEIGATAIGTTDEGFERRKRMAEAKLRLAFLKRYDRVIESYRQLAGRQDLPSVEIAAWRERRRREYRQATGVEIEQRDALEAGLQEIARSGAKAVSAVVEELRWDYANRLSWSDERSGSTGAAAS